MVFHASNSKGVDKCQSSAKWYEYSDQEKEKGGLISHYKYYFHYIT
jgi:hypothetical protein